MPEPHREVLELHDSELLAVDSYDGEIRVTLRAYIHRLPVRVGESGTGWTQVVELLFEHASLEQRILELPCELADGSITGALNEDNLIPLPCDVDGALQFTARNIEGQTLGIRSAALRIVRLGELTFVEVTPADLYRDLKQSGSAA